MGIEGFRFADRGEQTKKINRFLVIGVFVFCFITACIVVGSYLNGYRSIGYLGAIVAVMLLGNVINFIMYKKMSQSTKIRIAALIELMVISLMISAVYESDYMRFMPVIPFIGTLLFYDVKYSLVGSLYITVMNWVVVLVRAFVMHDFPAEDVPDRLTACLVITVMMFIVLYTTLVGKKFNEDSLNRVKSEADKQKEMVDDVLRIAEQVRKDTENAMTIVDDLKESAEVVRHSVTDISESTNMTAENIQTQTLMTQNIQENIEKTVSRSEHMVRVAERSNELNSSNMEMIQELKKQADVLAATNAQVAEAMRQLRDNVSSVKNITNTIVSISSQTNLLALNASIESARAGEAGRGFAVVADQIRELSESTRKETEQISAILEELTRNADQTAEAVEKSVEVSNEQDRMITGVADQFDEMNRNVGELVGDISEIDNMIESLSTANNQIVDNIMQLSATTEEVTAAAQQSTEITERNYKDSVDAQKLLHGVLEVSHQMDKYI
ncbi:MAG: hypothetical protein J6K04_02610 [Lachnospiraceae bacterium]|nr:hypothetical protein [Lachnospiraceae bacterium]